MGECTETITIREEDFTKRRDKDQLWVEFMEEEKNQKSLSR